MPIKVEKKGPIFARPTAIILSRAIRDAADRHGPEFVKILKGEARKDTEEFSKSIDYTVVGSGINSRLVVFANAPSAVWAEKGRKKGKQPPLMGTGEEVTRGPRKGEERMQSILVPWVERRGWGASIQERRQIAFAIAKHIAQRGVPGQFIFRDFRERHPAEAQAFYKDLEEMTARLFGE